MVGMILLMDNFEDTEAITTIDLLKRANINLDMISFNDSKKVKSKYGLSLNIDKCLKEINPNKYDFLIIPGGQAVIENFNNQEIEKLIMNFELDHKLICTICAAPSLVGKLGIFKDEDFTCFPSFEDYCIDGKYKKNKQVIVNNNHITAKAAGAVFLFAFAIIEKIKGKDAANKVLESIYYK